MPLPSPDQLPENLPPPQDDGGADHLVGLALPSLTLASTDGIPVRLDLASTGRWVLFVYPMTGGPGDDDPIGWDLIPGARGCSQEACSFRDNLATLEALGTDRVLALSSDKSEHQSALVDRFHLPYPMLSDPELALSESLGLPTFDAAGMTLFKRLTMIVHGATVEHVFYPIFPPNRHADEVIAWLTANPATGS